MAAPVLDAAWTGPWTQLATPIMSAAATWARVHGFWGRGICGLSTELRTWKSSLLGLQRGPSVSFEGKRHTASLPLGTSPSPSDPLLRAAVTPGVDGIEAFLAVLCKCQVWP
jgi:hypothetical protein